MRLWASCRPGLQSVKAPWGLESVPSSLMLLAGFTFSLAVGQSSVPRRVGLFIGLASPRAREKREHECERERRAERGWDGGREGEGSYSLFIEPNLRSNTSVLPYVIGHTNWRCVARYYTGCEKPQAAITGAVLKAGYYSHPQALQNSNICPICVTASGNEFSPGLNSERDKWETTFSPQMAFHHSMLNLSFSLWDRHLW